LSNWIAFGLPAFACINIILPIDYGHIHREVFAPTQHSEGPSDKTFHCHYCTNFRRIDCVAAHLLVAAGAKACVTTS
jgi:hypothetical protein